MSSPLALVRDGNAIALDVPARTLDLQVPTGKLDERRRHWCSPVRAMKEVTRAFVERVMQADWSAGLDFLASCVARGAQGKPLADKPWLRVKGGHG